MFDSIYKSAKEAASDLNPIANNIRKKDKEIIKTLLSAGFKGKDIVSFVDVYKSDVEEYVNTIKEAIKMNKEMNKAS